MKKVTSSSMGNYIICLDASGEGKIYFTQKQKKKTLKKLLRGIFVYNIYGSLPGDYNFFLTFVLLRKLSYMDGNVK